MCTCVCACLAGRVHLEEPVVREEESETICGTSRQDHTQCPTPPHTRDPHLDLMRAQIRMH